MYSVHTMITCLLSPELGIWGLRFCNVVDKVFLGHSHCKIIYFWTRHIKIATSEIHLIKNVTNSILDYKKMKLTASAQLWALLLLLSGNFTHIILRSSVQKAIGKPMDIRSFNKALNENQNVNNISATACSLFTAKT